MTRIVNTKIICALVGLIFVMGIKGVSSNECGTTEFFRELVTRGSQTNRGEYPFLVALYLVEELKFYCGGSLVSPRHVLTAAHCMHQKNVKMKLLPVDVVVLLGAYDLTSKIERGVTQRDVTEIHVHPDWKVYSDKYDADLAILVLSKNVSYTNYIRPVCLPTDDAVIIGARGSVVGWGLTENGEQLHMEYPKQAISHVLNYSYCYTTDYLVAFISSPRTFCGRGEIGSPNQGDSGGGFFVRYGSVWVQYGVISALRSNATGYVDADSIAVYTNIKDFKSWIEGIITQSRGAVDEANEINIMKINLNCNYNYDYGWYGCFVDNLDVRSTNIEVGVVSGSHHNKKTNHDVGHIHFRSGTMIYLPNGIGKIFKALKSVEIGPYLTVKSIRRSFFLNFETVIILKILKSDIENIEEDCLWDLQNLEFFVLAETQLKEMKEMTFERNVKLREISLYSNRFELVPKNVFRNNLLLEIVRLNGNSLNNIDERSFSDNIKLKKIYLHTNQLKFIPENLFENNFLLESISIFNNSINIINEGLFVNNVKLREVYLHSNQLNYLPSNLFENNFLLEIVDLGDNFFEMIDERTFTYNTKLKEVYLYSNQLQFLHWNLFQNNLVLELVSLFNNSLNLIIDGSFSSNTKLRQVFLYHNQLQYLPEKIFENNLLLETVNLSHNLIELIPANLFKNNLLLKKVDFNNNRLRVIEIDFSGFENINQIFLYNNVCINDNFETTEDTYINEIKKSNFSNAIRTNCSIVKT